MPVNNKETEKEQTGFKPKPPVVVVLGHIDAGKTAILDYIRKTNIAEQETGGITQHIGAYEIEKNNRKITFIDTPGHEAFSAMRSRGAKVADIAILVVDATAGIQAQTKEALKAIKKAQLPFVVVLNKIDKNTAQPQKAKTQLASEGILTEDMGGKIPVVETSAKTGQGIDDLLEIILLLSDVEGLKTNYQALPQGTVIESSLDPKEGPTATIILEQGILKEKDIIGTESAFGRVKALFNFQGKRLKNALPSQPVRILGFNKVPRVGEKIRYYESLEQARRASTQKQKKEVSPQVLQARRNKKVLNIIIKADVLGSLEAIEGVLKNIPQEKVFLRLLKADVGPINLNDVQTAEISQATIFAFRVEVDPDAKKLAQQKKVRICRSDIIYELVQAVRKSMEEVLEPKIEKQILGSFLVTVLFKQGTSEQIIGGKVLEGNLTKNLNFEVVRNKEVIGQGKIKNIQQERRNVDNVKKGQEAGLLIEAPFKIKEGDLLTIYREEIKKQTL